MQAAQRNTFCSIVIPYLQKDFKHIAGRTKGELEPEDIASEAFLLVHRLSFEENPLPAPDDPAFHSKVISYLQNELVKWADKHYRMDVRLDEARLGDDGSEAPNPVAARLAGPAWSDPLEALTQHEEQLELELVIESRYTEAIGYAHTFSNLGQDRRTLANHFAIAICTLDRRRKHAERVAVVQPSLFDGINAVPDVIPPRPMVAPRLGHYADMAAWLDRMMKLLQLRLFPRAPVPIRLLVQGD